MSKKTGSGFSFGVALGAALGTGAMILHNTREGKKIKKKLIKAFRQTAANLEEKYPQESAEVQSILKEALSEAQKATDEIKGLSLEATAKAKQKSKLMKQAVKAAKKEKTKRTFSRSGKPLSPSDSTS